MQTALLLFICSSVVITTIVNFAKPGYEELVGKYATTINILLSFILGIASAFAISPYIGLELSGGALVLLGLALGTGSTIFYDVWKLVQNFGSEKPLD